jgi:hypothetical protein
MSNDEIFRQAVYERICGVMHQFFSRQPTEAERERFMRHGTFCPGVAGQQEAPVKVKRSRRKSK